MAKVKFEDKITELESIISELESGNASLEDSIDKYTKAMKLAKECDEELKTVEERISKLVLESGEIKDFEVSE